MRKIAITQECAEDLVLSILKEDLKNMEDELVEWLAPCLPQPYIMANVKSVKKHIKTLKRAINFYSVETVYENF